jgi:hypothetical protein
MSGVAEPLRELDLLMNLLGKARHEDSQPVLRNASQHAGDDGRALVHTRKKNIVVQSTLCSPVVICGLAT